MLEIINKLMAKIMAVMAYLILTGILFLVLAVVTILYPVVIMYCFVITFGVVAILCFLAAERVYRIKELVEKLTLWGKK